VTLPGQASGLRLKASGVGWQTSDLIDISDIQRANFRGNTRPSKGRRSTAAASSVPHVAIGICRMLPQVRLGW
jgi:hypothetical protein